MTYVNKRLLLLDWFESYTNFSDAFRPYLRRKIYKFYVGLYYKNNNSDVKYIFLLIYQHYFLAHCVSEQNGGSFSISFVKVTCRLIPSILFLMQWKILASIMIAHLGRRLPRPVRHVTRRLWRHAGTRLGQPPNGWLP